MLISGKIATIGVTCKTMAKGKNDISTHFDWVNRIARPTPPNTASSRLRKVMRSVTSSDENSSARSVVSVAATTPGRGRMYRGISFHTQRRSHSHTAATMMRNGQQPPADPFQPGAAGAPRLLGIEREGSGAPFFNGRHCALPQGLG
jgi:hypothetical protein